PVKLLFSFCSGIVLNLDSKRLPSPAGQINRTFLSLSSVTAMLPADCMGRNGVGECWSASLTLSNPSVPLLVTFLHAS
ncbi:MAG TPA: hypothetical protein VKG86_01370, partial [Terracidiphilus sp.]|nr:hypothetical protein [Terracidiphilus sp.]